MDYFLGENKFTAGRYYDDTCNTYREENRKKDEIIRQLCKINPDGGVDSSHVKTLPQFQKNEVAILEVKIDKLEEKLRHKQKEIERFQDEIAVVKKEKEMHRLEAENLSNTNRKLVMEKAQIQTQIETFESLKYRNEYSLKYIQDQYQQSQRRVAELEARIKCHSDERERLDQSKYLTQSKYQNFIIGLSRVISITDVEDTDTILEKISDLSKENALLNGKVQSIEYKVSTAEEEAKNARETIVKLMRDYGEAGVGSENFRESKNLLKVENDDLKNQLELLKNRQESLQKAYDVMREESEEKTSKMLEFEVKLREQDFSKKASETVTKSLLESLAAYLSTPFITCQPTEAAVKERVRQLVDRVKEQNTAAESLDKRVLQLQRQFESQYETGKQLMEKSKDSNTVKQELESKISQLENELLAQEVLRDNLKSTVERLTRQIMNLADILQVDYLPSDSDAVGLIGLLQERCQEMSLSNNFGVTKKCTCRTGGGMASESQVQSKRIMSLKEELEAKDLQLRVLEKRLSQQQQSQTPRESFQCPIERGSETSREKAHRLQHQLEECQVEIEDLRRALVQSQASEFDTHKQELQKQHREVEELSSALEKLDKVRQKQAKKIASLKSICDDKDSQIQNHSKKLQDYKQARHMLEEIRRHEMELEEFRNTVAGLLGVDVHCSPDPTRDVCGRIKKLLAMSQSATSTPFTPYYLSQDMPAGFQMGYNKPLPLSCLPANSKLSAVTFEEEPKASSSSSVFSRREQVPRSKIAFQTSGNKKSKFQSRARSTSPVQVDERKY